MRGFKFTLKNSPIKFKISHTWCCKLCHELLFRSKNNNPRSN